MYDHAKLHAASASAAIAAFAERASHHRRPRPATPCVS
jgi:hypothetical protein